MQFKLLNKLIIHELLKSPPPRSQDSETFESVLNREDSIQIQKILKTEEQSEIWPLSAAQTAPRQAALRQEALRSVLYRI